MAEKDFPVSFPVEKLVNGDNVIYSTRPFVAAGNGRPLSVGAPLSGERDMNHFRSWFAANQDGTIKIQGWDIATGAWILLKTTSAPTASGAATIDEDIPGGDWQVVLNFAVAPTVFNHPTSHRLSKRQS